MICTQTLSQNNPAMAGQRVTGGSRSTDLARSLAGLVETNRASNALYREAAAACPDAAVRADLTLLALSMLEHEVQLHAAAESIGCTLRSAPTPAGAAFRRAVQRPGVNRASTAGLLATCVRGAQASIEAYDAVASGSIPPAIQDLLTRHCEQLVTAIEQLWALEQEAPDAIQPLGVAA